MNSRDRVSRGRVLTNLKEKTFGKRTLTKREENSSGVFVTTQIKILELAIHYVVINAKPSTIGAHRLVLTDNLCLQLNPKEKEERVFLPIMQD